MPEPEVPKEILHFLTAERFQFRYHYFKSHYFDNVDFAIPPLAYTHLCGKIKKT
jgi:hypothetical protein